MSDALNYLLKARPEALGHYFAFIKDAGSKLDPKTRSLISVITKVHGQTDRGLRQYVKRALRDGCTAEEILDALLMAFPALGLTKILWAVDVLLAMDLPEFQRLLTSAPNEGDPPRWREALCIDGFEVGATRRIVCDGRGLFVHRAAEGWRVYDSRCPHQSTEIPEASLVGTTLTCPQHQWAFDVRSGDCVRVGDGPLRQIEHRIDGARLMVHW